MSELYKRIKKIPHIKGILVVVVVFFVLAMVCYYIDSDKNVSTNAVANNAGAVSAGQPMHVTYNNIESYLMANSMIRDLPEGTAINLRFFNFNSGLRQWEKSYILTKGSAKEGLSNSADITLSLHSKYLTQFTTQNFCGVIKQANANGDLGFESSLSKVSLLWKFKSMMKYRDCLGF
jgi:hypothetical protein